MNSPPEHHKEIAVHLKERANGNSTVAIYRDDNGKRPVPIGTFGEGKDKLYSTIGQLDAEKDIPDGDFEFAVFGSQVWVPNALVSSIYWLKGRKFENWPVICEDVIKINTRSTYRHMAFVPSSYSLRLKGGRRVSWLLGLPLRDSEISLSHQDIVSRVQGKFPQWLTLI